MRALNETTEVQADREQIADRDALGAKNERRVLIVQEHSLLASGLMLALSERLWTVETNSGSSSGDVIDHIEAFKPQCVLLNLHLHDSSGLDLIGPAVSLGSKVVMLTAERRRAILAACLDAGAVGWIKVTDELGSVDSTLADVVAGRPIIGRTQRSELLELLRTERAAGLRAQATFSQLTQREALVLAALTQGLSADEIAKAHFVALTTVRSQIRSILQKLGVRSQLAAVALADNHRALLPRGATADADRRRSEPLSLRSEPDYATRSA